MIPLIRLFILAFCLLFAQQGAMRHAISHLGVVAESGMVESHHETGKDDGSPLCLQCLAYSVLAAAIGVVWVYMAAIRQHFLVLIANFLTIPQRAFWFYAARAPPA